jgi:hypothetical protein
MIGFEVCRELQELEPMKPGRLCTTCGQALGRYGHFVRTPDGFRHAGCPPDPATVAQVVRAPALDDVTPRERRSAAMRKLWDGRREERAAARAAEDAVRSSRSAPTSMSPPEEDLSLYTAAIAPPRASPPIVVEPVPAPVGSADKLCIRCGRLLGEFGFFRLSPYGRYHLVCPRKPLVEPPPRSRGAPPKAPAECQAAVAEDEADDTRERCVRCGRGLGSVAYWIGTAVGKRHSVCPRPPTPVATKGDTP